ncbi:hypothetical protein P879_08236 [Paragonimus westermani]|uniref:Uncharacterized protein n=1 Tax=Paragonimus westermani TaxID=34504 RepID=A0A8T0DNA8_9TREM|nr:hypothetical protein P879_08236 [Paragonimus westermani]
MMARTTGFRITSVLRDIRQRKRARVHSKEPAETNSTLPPENTEDDASRAECLPQDQVDYKTEARQVASDLCEELKKIINFIALGVNFVVEPVENCYATAPTPSSGLTETSASNV